MIEYAVMKQVGDNEPVIVDQGFTNYDSAERSCNKFWGSLDLRGGHHGLQRHGGP